MAQPVQQSPGESLAAHHLGPILKGQIGGNDQAGLLIGSADHLKEQFCSGFAEGHIAQFVQDQADDDQEGQSAKEQRPRA